MIAMIRSRMPHKTRFAYTRLPVSVTHQPVPANASIPLRPSKPATRNITTAAKVSMPGLLATASPERLMGASTPPGIGSLCCAISSLLSFASSRLRLVDGLLDLFSFCPDLLLHLPLGALRLLLAGPL